MIQVIYSADENQILIRKALGTRNISGDYNNYQKEETITVDEMQVTLKGTFVWEAVKALPDKYREVIHLFHYEGYSTAQIGKMLKRKEAWKAEIKGYFEGGILLFPAFYRNSDRRSG